MPDIRTADGTDILKALREAAARRILVLDGAMGTEIQALKLSEGDFRGERFRDHAHDLKGNNDLLILTQPDAVRELLRGEAWSGEFRRRRAAERLWALLMLQVWCDVQPAPPEWPTAGDGYR